MNKTFYPIQKYLLRLNYYKTKKENKHDTIMRGKDQI